VRALDVYDRVIKIVAPKKLKLAAAEAELAVQMKKLNAKRKQLKDVSLHLFIFLPNFLPVRVAQCIHWRSEVSEKRFSPALKLLQTPWPQKKKKE